MELNGRLREDHCLGFWCNGASVTAVDGDEQIHPCECDCGPCESTKRHAKMIAAMQQAIPWLVLLGDYIGNGTKEQPEGRCEAIAAIHDALGDHDIPNARPHEVRSIEKRRSAREIVLMVRESAHGVALPDQTEMGAIIEEVVKLMP